MRKTGFTSLSEFISYLEAQGELIRIKKYVSPNLEITEITDRISKLPGGGKAVLFENTGFNMPVLTNMMGSENRMGAVLRTKNPEALFDELTSLVLSVRSDHQGWIRKLTDIFSLAAYLRYFPKKKNRKGKCQYQITMNPDLEKIPVLKCWPFDGGNFITLPIVITEDPDTALRNAGMYRMQVIDSKTTAMHWHVHKTGAKHFRKYQKKGKRMPVAVALGGDPILTYCATAPLPEGMDEFLFAGMARKKSVGLVKCITNDLWVPDEADIILEGYIDPSEPLFYEGPFGDHTGFYSLPDFFPVFHITCITTSENPVYPATIVGIPPQEDAWIARATEKIFLKPLQLAVCPELITLRMPAPGVAHNLAIAGINCDYEGAAYKTAHSLWGAGQMMFNKILVIINAFTDPDDYKSIFHRFLHHCVFSKNLYFGYGPLDVLDHSSSKSAQGSKLCIDLTDQSTDAYGIINDNKIRFAEEIIDKMKNEGMVSQVNNLITSDNLPVLIIALNRNIAAKKIINHYFNQDNLPWRLIIVTDCHFPVDNLYLATWYVLANIDPKRDISVHPSQNVLIADGTSKNLNDFKRQWPNPVVMNNETIEKIDKKWSEIDLYPLLVSPSGQIQSLVSNPGAFRIFEEME